MTFREFKILLLFFKPKIIRRLLSGQVQCYKNLTPEYVTINKGTVKII